MTRTVWRFIILLILAVVLAAGWSWLWRTSAEVAGAAIEGWRAREAKAGRIYNCGSQSIGGFPFRFEVSCDKVSVTLQSSQPPLAINASKLLIAAEVYAPTTLTSEFSGPLTVADPGHTLDFIANWSFGRLTLGGTPALPERMSLLFDNPIVDRVNGSQQQNFLHAKRIDVRGRIVEGSAVKNPVVEVTLHLAAASLPGLHAAAVTPIDADITWVLRGLSDFSPKPWPARFRQLQAEGGRIDLTQARVQQGPTTSVGQGTLSLNAAGRLQGEIQVTIAGLEPFLAAIGAQKAVQASPDMDKVAGALDRLLPGLGNVAREQAGANLSAGISLLGQQTMLEGQRAVALPLRFDDGAIFLGPIPIGKTPALF